MRNLEACGTSPEESKNFEFTCIGEVRMLCALKHPCIVEIYGHQISSKWVPSSDGNTERIVQSAILMEYIEGGSLKVFLIFFLRQAFIYKSNLISCLLCCMIKDTRNEIPYDTIRQSNGFCKKLCSDMKRLHW